MKAKGYSTIAGLDKLSPEEIKQRNMETYGSRIKTFRTRAGMTAEQLADALQISKSSIRNWECGLTRPDLEFLYRMFSILDVEPNEFFGFSGIGTLLTTSERDLIDNYRSLDDAVDQSEPGPVHAAVLRRSHLQGRLGRCGKGRRQCGDPYQKDPFHQNISVAVMGKWSEM